MNNENRISPTPSQLSLFGEPYVNDNYDNVTANTGPDGGDDTPPLQTPEQERYLFLTARWQQLLPTVSCLTPDPGTWDIEGDPATAEGYVFYLPAADEAVLSVFLENPHQAFKVVNPGQPAVKLTYYTKHHYFVRKPDAISTREKQELIAMYVRRLSYKVAVLFGKSKKAARIARRPREPEMTTRGTALIPNPVMSTIAGELAFYQDELREWETIQKNQTDYELILTNYNRGYRYTYINYKYKTASANLREKSKKADKLAGNTVTADDRPANQRAVYDNCQVQLLKHQQDKDDWILEYRYNFVLIDTDGILKRHDYQHKQVETYIAGFPTASDIALTKAGQLRVRLLAEVNPETGIISCQSGVVNPAV